MGARVLAGDSLAAGCWQGRLNSRRAPQLVVFVPEHSAIAVNEIKNPNLAKTATERTVQVASFEMGKQVCVPFMLFL